MRGAVESLPSPVPVATLLPGIYQDLAFTQRFTEAFDVALAPVITTLDALWTYVDPSMAPEDFLPWLASWVGTEIDTSWPVALQRSVIAHAVEVHRRRGTVAGVRAAVLAAAGPDVEVEVEDSGGVSWSSSPGSPLPGTSRREVVVRLRVGERATLARGWIDEVVAGAVPAHVRATVEIVGPDPGARP